ncbi:unnamed protein product, partial [marine sediment metagenome]
EKRAEAEKDLFKFINDLFFDQLKNELKTYLIDYHNFFIEYNNKLIESKQVEKKIKKELEDTCKFVTDQINGLFQNNKINEEKYNEILNLLKANNNQQFSLK